MTSLYPITLEVEILDAEGCTTDRTVKVYLDVVKEVDYSYGADADGNRGITHTFYNILDVWIDHKDLKTLTLGEAQQAIKDAEAIFKQRNSHFN